MDNKPISPTEVMREAVGVIFCEAPKIYGFLDEDKLNEILQQKIEGPNCYFRDCFYVRFDQTEEVSCTLNFILFYRPTEKKFMVDITVSWGRMQCSPAQSQASIALYQQVTNLACLIESKVGMYRNITIVEE